MRTIALVVLLLSCGAVSARQPAVRTSVPLPAPAEEIAAALSLPTVDRSRLILDVVRAVFDAPDGLDESDARLRSRLAALIAAGKPGAVAPLPLDPSIWRETLLRRQVPDEGLLGAVLSERRTALLYHGLAALDDETLGWLGPQRDLLIMLGEHAGTFAAFGRSLRVSGERVLVPGGAKAEPVWSDVVGARPNEPVEFVRRLFSRSNGHLAFFYDTIAHLDEPARQFVLVGGRADRVRALAEVFERTALELKPRDRPFSRQFIDPALTLAAIESTPGGVPVGPTARGLWEAVFKGGDRTEVHFGKAAVSRNAESSPVDAAWLVSRIHQYGAGIARRRLDAFLFAQRQFRDTSPTDMPAMATALRGVLAFPALMVTLERAGVQSPALLAASVKRAAALSAIGDNATRRVAITQFQASLGILERMVFMGGISPGEAATSIALLVDIDFSEAQGQKQFSSWVSRHLVPGATTDDGSDSAEAALLAAMAGRPAAGAQTVDWEGRRYRVDPAGAELERLRGVRQRQRGPSLDEVLASAQDEKANGRGRDRDEVEALAQVLTSILYAAYLGEPDSTALAAGNAALRHDLGIETGAKPTTATAWRVASESFGSGWMLRGSLLALNVPLARFALRRLDTTEMPPPPKLTTNERHTAAVTASLLRPHMLTDGARDAIAAGIARGRARVAALGTDRSDIEKLASEAGLSEWRREALAWSLVHDRERAAGHFSLLELFWLGRKGPAEDSLDDWGAAAFPLSGCLCLRMPHPAPWERYSGRPSAGLLATRGVDVNLLAAEALARLQLPAALAPGIVAFAMQDVLDAAQPAHFDDWSEFGRSAAAVPESRMADYIAALTAGGPLRALPPGGKRP